MITSPPASPNLQQLLWFQRRSVGGRPRLSRIGATLRLSLLGLVCACAGVAAQAADAAPESMLILDASGSMWGQVGGKAKIVLAREAVAQMLTTWPAGQDLGLMAYGHRRKGDCGDIELLRAPQPVAAAEFTAAAGRLQPKGMTPISAAVRQAAEILKFTEHKATVILVSDGEETCNADPCALGAELARAGIDFKAHVVGFDLPEGQARSQLQCLASSTGGRYVEARDAAALNAALTELAKAPLAPAKPAALTDLRPTKGCQLFEGNNFTGASILLGEAGYDNEMPPGWDNRVRSVRCSAYSGLYLYNDPGRDGNYLMIEDGGVRNHLGALASSYIYFGNFSDTPQ